MFGFRNTWILTVFSIAYFCLPASFLYADETNLSASKDNTLYSEGDLSNGAGSHLFAGTTGIGDFRRALIQFDIAANVPSGASILGVQLSLNVSRVPDNDVQQISLMRLSSDWGEGSSNAPLEEGRGADATSGDATWLHSFFPFDFWSAVGGDFVNNASAMTLVGGLGHASWTTTDALVADVQQWLDQPQSNFGWLLIGAESSAGTAKRFDSREIPQAGLAPRLQIVFEPLPPTGACCSTSGECTDVLATACQASGGLFKSPGSSCELIQECPIFQDGFEN